jgi:hypothetical protein
LTFPLSEHPLRIYTVARRYGWEEEAKLASTETLKLNIHAPEHRPLLSRLSTEALLDLFDLHRERRDALRTRLAVSPFIVGDATLCVSCHWRVEYATWRELKYKMIMEMDERPLGDTIVENGLHEWLEADACWKAKCPNSECGRLLYDKSLTIRAITETVAALRATI